MYNFKCSPCFDLVVTPPGQKRDDLSPFYQPPSPQRQPSSFAIPPRNPDVPLDTLFHPALTDPRFYYISKRLGFSEAEWPQLRGVDPASPPAGPRLRNQPGYEDIPACPPVAGPSAPKVQGEKASAPPGKGLRRTQNRNARKRKRAAALRRQKEFGIEVLSGSEDRTPYPGQEANDSDADEDLDSAEKAEITGETAGDQQFVMLGLSNKNKRRGFKREMLKHLAASGGPTRIRFDGEINGDQQGKGVALSLERASRPPHAAGPPSALPADQVPPNVKVTSIDVEATDFVPGQPQPGFVPPRRVTGTQIVNGVRADEPNKDTTALLPLSSGEYDEYKSTMEEVEQSGWRGWPTAENLESNWSHFRDVERTDTLAPGARIAVQVNCLHGFI
jgi:hypothetical protein